MINSSIVPFICINFQTNLLYIDAEQKDSIKVLELYTISKF